MIIGRSKLNRQKKKDNLNINYESYEFIDDIMEDDTLLEEEKEKFWKNFATRYINSVEFRYQTHGGKIVFDSKNKYRGYYENEEIALEIINERGLIFSYIGDDDIPGKMYKFIFTQRKR